MTPTLTTTSTGPTSAVASVDERRSGRRVVLGVSLTATLIAYGVIAGPMMVTAVRGVASASVWWLLVASVGTVGSMLAFAALRRRTIAVSGMRIPLRPLLAISYAAGAVHTTLPAGTVFSTNYAFRQLRRRGVSPSTVTWSMTITGLLSSVTLAMIGMAGMLLRGGATGNVAESVIELIVAVFAIGGLAVVVRRPSRLIHSAQRILIVVNGIRKRPAETGFARLTGIVDELSAIRPSRRDWFASFALALANWLLDLVCLAACCAALGVHVSFAALLLTYTAGMAAGSLLPLPAGLGAVETAMTLSLTVAGAAAAPALGAVLLYRLLSTGSVVLIGWLILIGQRVSTKLPHSRFRV